MFRHKPFDLSKDSIRVLRLIPASDIKAPLTGQLSTLEIIDGEPLELSAISYASEGEKQNPKYTLTCLGGDGSEEGQLSLTGQCRDVLRAMRRRNRSILLWIDLVCIDQANLGERNHQARISVKVFSTVRTVFIWLGKHGTDNATQALKFIAEFAVPNTPENGHYRHRLEAASRLLRKAGHTTILGDIFGRSWFGRVWTLQEMVVAPRQIILVCGATRVPWTSFIYALSWLADIDQRQFSIIYNGCRPFLVLQDMVFQKRAGVDAGQMEKAASSDADSNFLDLVDLRKRRATDPRDMVFGIYGLAQELNRSLPPPDYQKDICQVYREAARFIIEDDKDLGILKMAQCLPRKIPLPSWTPDWSAQLPIDQSPIPEHLEIPGFRPFQTPFSCAFSPDGTKLTVRGKILDKVIRTARPFPIRNAPDSSSSRLDTWAVFRDCIKVLQDNVWGECPIKKSVVPFRRFERAIMGGSPDLIAAEPYKRYDHDTFTSLCSIATLSTSEIRSIVAVGSPTILKMDAGEVTKRTLELLLLDSESPGGGEYFSLYALLQRLLPGRGFFISSTSCLGTVFGAARAGDAIGVLDGLDMAVVLSPVGNNFRFVGLAYAPEITKNDPWADCSQEIRRVTLI